MNAEPGVDIFMAMIKAGGLILLAVFVARAVGRRYGTVAGILAIMGVVLLPVSVLLFFWTVSRSQQARDQPVEVMTMVAANIQADNSGRTDWSDVDLQQFTADVYPGPAAAAEGLALRVRMRFDRNHPGLTLRVTDPEASGNLAEMVEHLDSTLMKAKDPESIIVSMVQSGGVDMGEMQHFADHLRQQFPDSRVTVLQILDDQDFDVTPGQKSMTIRLSHEVTSETMLESLNVTQPVGIIRCAIQDEGIIATETVEYVSKPWVDDLAAFVSAHPNRNFVVGYSQGLQSSEPAARQLAVENAAGKFVMRLGNTEVRPDESHVIDRFAQKLSRPYGDVWREAVLMDVSHDRFIPQIATVHRQVVRTRHQRTSSVVAVILLFGTALVMCLLLNWLTQGYYRGRLTIILWLALSAFGVALVTLS